MGNGMGPPALYEGVTAQRVVSEPACTRTQALDAAVQDAGATEFGGRGGVRSIRRRRGVERDSLGGHLGMRARTRVHEMEVGSVLALVVAVQAKSSERASGSPSKAMQRRQRLRVPTFPRHLDLASLSDPLSLERYLFCNAPLVLYGPCIIPNSERCPPFRRQTERHLHFRAVVTTPKSARRAMCILGDGSGCCRGLSPASRSSTRQGSTPVVS